MTTTTYVVVGTDFTGGRTEFTSLRKAISWARRRVNATIYRGELAIARATKREVYTANPADVFAGRKGWTQAILVLPKAGVDLTREERRFLCPTV